MKERAIRLNPNEVRAIIDGRKTQVLRPVKPQPDARASGSMGPNAYRDHAQFYFNVVNDRGGHRIDLERVKCPYGKPGDRLWGQETWGVVSYFFDAYGNRVKWQPDRPAIKIHEMPFGRGYYSGHVIYAADGGFEWSGDDGMRDPQSAWKPSVQMPRVASRILLKITGIRVERLQEINDSDIKHQGIIDCPKVTSGETEGSILTPFGKRMLFADEWELVYGDDSWDQNPWVWVVDFKLM